QSANSATGSRDENRWRRARGSSRVRGTEVSFENDRSAGARSCARWSETPGSAVCCEIPLQTTFEANSLHPHKAGYLQGLLRSQRRRSRTYPAVGYTTSPVLKTGWATGPVPLRGAG